MKKRLLLILGILFGLILSPNTFAQKNPTNPPNTPSQTTSKKENTNLVTAIEEVAKTAGPAVVAIRTERTEHVRGYVLGSPFEDEFFNRFFEDFFGDRFQQEYKSAGLGSGVIIDPKGYILTNEHVVGRADKILVRLADGREAKGKLTGTDPRSDLAVVKIDLPNLPSAPLGDSDHLKIGQWVVAIGNPFGHILSNPEPTVTTGVISALQRSLPRNSRRDSDYTDLIQTDAAINPGNSGGPLVNLEGEVVGINVAIFSTSGGYQGIGFAIPISHAKRIIDQLISGKEINYGWIGVAVQDINRRLADYFGLTSTEGVLVTGLLDGSPAQKAGIQNGDVILSVDEKNIKNGSALIRVVGDLPIGKKAPVKILRDGKSLTIPVVIEKRPAFDEEGRMVKQEEPEENPPENEPPPARNQSWRGLKVADIASRNLEQENQEAAEGAVIVEIDHNRPAEETGLRRGDIITAINHEPIKNVDDFYRVITKAKGDCLILTTRGFFVIKSK